MPWLVSSAILSVHTRNRLYLIILIQAFFFANSPAEKITAQNVIITMPCYVFDLKENSVKAPLHVFIKGCRVR